MAVDRKPKLRKLPKGYTANRLADGVVVYLAADGGWGVDMAESRLASSAAEASGDNSSTSTRSSSPWLKLPTRTMPSSATATRPAKRDAALLMPETRPA